MKTIEITQKEYVSYPQISVVKDRAWTNADIGFRCRSPEGAVLELGVENSVDPQGHLAWLFRFHKIVTEYQWKVVVGDTEIRQPVNGRLEVVDKGDFHHTMTDRGVLLLTNLALEIQKLRTVADQPKIQK